VSEGIFFACQYQSILDSCILLNYRAVLLLGLFEQTDIVHIDPITHVIKQAEYLPSPNKNQRPDEALIDLIVIHNISLPPGQYGGGYVQKFFLNQLDTRSHPYFESIESLCVSSHLLIERDGELTQFVPFNERAWHAGESIYQQRTACNDFSIGIELEGTDSEAYTTQQYDKLNQVLACLIAHYPSLRADKIVGHNDISPGRKTDPGHAFEWSRIKV